MKRFLTCALCFVSLPAVAVTLYYDKTNGCDGLHTGPSCDGSPVTHLNVTPVPDSIFTGFKLNGQTIVDANGNIVSNAAKILSSANLGTNFKIPQDYTCQGSLVKNALQICVDTSGNTIYVDPARGDDGAGYEVAPAQVGRGEPNPELCRNYSKFKIKIHWCPPKPGTYVWTDNSGFVGWSPTLTPEYFDMLYPGDAGCAQTEVLDYEWKRNDCTSSTCATYKDQSGAVVSNLYPPTAGGAFNGWTLRGLYMHTGDLSVVPSGCNGPTGSANPDCISYWGSRNIFALRRVVSKTNMDGVARLGLPKNSTDVNYIPLSDGSMNNWSNTRWTVRECWDGEIPDNDVAQIANRTYHLYAGWAKNCYENADGGNAIPGACSLDIKRTGLSNPDKGDAVYTTYCTTGVLNPDTANTWNPICEIPKTIYYRFRYEDVDGHELTGCSGGPSSSSCDISNDYITTILLPSLSNVYCSGTNYKLLKWRTSNGVHYVPGTSADCTIEALGGTNAKITGVLCDCNSNSSRVVCMGVCN